MERIKLYLFTLLTLWSVLSCTDGIGTSPADSDTDPDTGTGRTEVSIFLSLPDEVRTVASRSFTDGTPPVDETTPEQHAIDERAIDVLAFRNGVMVGYAGSVTARRQSGGIRLTFSFPHSQVSGRGIRFAVLANLSPSVNPDVIRGLADGVGQTAAEVYSRLVYSYSGPWNLSSRLIPMWGITPEITLVPGVPIAPLSCALHRALAKVGFRVNVDAAGQAQGYPQEKLLIRSVTVRGAMNSGLVAPLSAGPADLSPEGYFLRPFIPSGARPHSYGIVYTNRAASGEAYTREFLNTVYLPEQDTGTHPLELEIAYSLYGVEQPPRTITFDPQEKVLRNHSYLYHITLNHLELDYEVVPWDPRDPVELPPFD